MKSFKYSISTAVDGNDDYVVEMAVKRIGASVRKMKALSIQMEGVTLIDRGREMHAFYIMCMK